MEHGEGSTGGTATMTASAVTMGNTTSQPVGEYGVHINNEFSSKGLSMFKDVGKFNSTKPMIDIAKPTLPTFENHEAHIEPKQETKNNSIVDIKHGKESPKSMFKDIGNFNQEKPMLDISKPYDSFAKETSHSKIEEARALDHTPPVINELKPDRVEEVRTETRNDIDTTIRPKVENKPEVQPEVRTEFDNRTTEELQSEELPHIKTETEAQPDVRTGSEPEVNTEKVTERQTETKTEVLPQSVTQPETEVVTYEKTETKIHHSPKVEVEVAVAQDILTATLAQQEKVSLAKAREAIAIAVRQEHTVEQHGQQELEQKQEKNKKKKTIEEKAREMVLKRKEEKQEFQNSSKKEEEGILYFDKDNEVNTYREMAAIAALERVARMGQEVTGVQLARAVTSQIEEGKGSEIVEGVQDDESGRAVVESIAKMGKIENSWTLRRMLRQITDRYTAVKLVSESHDGAGKQNAENVYGRDIDGVGAHFEEENSTGQMRELENGQVVYIARRPPQPLPVAAGEIS